MAVAALRNLVSKIRIPVVSTLRAPRAQALSPLPPLPPPPKGDLVTALLLKNKIQTAEAKELRSSGDLIAERCEETEEILSQVSERYSQVSRKMGRVTLRYFCTGAVLAFIQHTVQSYYYKKPECDAEERGLAAEGGLKVE